MRKFVFISIMTILLMTIAACGQAGNSSEAEKKKDGDDSGIVIEHEMGKTNIPEAPQKIVALEFSFVDALASLDISPIGIADDNDESRIIEPIREKIGDYTSVGTRKQPSLEIISSLQPDLIIADLQRHKEIYQDLSEIAPTIVINSLGADYDGIVSGFITIAEAVGQKEKGQQVLNEHKQRMEEIRALVPEDENRTVLPAVVASSGFFAHNYASYTGSLLESIGLKNAMQTGDERYNKINLEQLIELNPDIIFNMQAGEATILDEWKDNPLWEEIEAVKTDSIYRVDRNMWSRFRGLISSEKILEDAVELLYNQ
ncbi:MAG: ABC transporter substrate-binding protein [Bacillaceae bacterium]|nr:ABC transporter substrate-binding protein [Bacillaceae bacterium]